jgi:hypothetical protein
MQTKKVLGALFILTIPLFNLMGAQSAQVRANAPCSVTVSAPIIEVKTGSELKVRIELTNLTDKDLVMELDKGSRGEFDYTIHVLGKDGQEPPETRYLRAVKGEDTFDPVSQTELIVVGSNGFRTVKPGETLAHAIDLNRLYLLKPGKYTVQVERFEGGTKTHAKSNKITVTVTS